jgi:fatty acid desaturase
MSGLSRPVESTPVVDIIRLSGRWMAVGIANFVVYWIAIIAAILLLALNSPWSLLALPCLIIVYHGTHEAVHGTLFPGGLARNGLSRAAVFVSGWLGFALVGHNFLFLRWSHGLHHSLGRTHEDYTLDGRAKNGGRLAKAKYYLNLLGFNCLFHEVVGYLYLVTPSRYHILDRRFKPWSFPKALYPVCQLGVLAVTVGLLFLAGPYFVACRLLFCIYWGLMQNVAHYGLEHGSVHAARTYRVSPILEFLLFKAGYRHVEHHAFPGLPGYCLDDVNVQNELVRVIGFRPEPRKGTLRYWKDVLRQFRGAEAEHVIATEWRQTSGTSVE